MKTLNDLQGRIDGTVQLTSCDITQIIAGLALYQAEVMKVTGGSSEAAGRLINQLAAVQAGIRNPQECPRRR